MIAALDQAHGPGRFDSTRAPVPRSPDHLASRSATSLACALPSSVRQDQSKSATLPCQRQQQARRVSASHSAAYAVCVLGAGTIGLLGLQSARASGADRVLITAKHPQQAAAARALGADTVILADADVQAELAALTGGEGPCCLIVMKELHIMGSHTYDYGPDMQRDFEVAVGLVASGRVQLDPFMGYRFPLEKIQDACQAALSKDGGLLKAMVVC